MIEEGKMVVFAVLKYRQMCLSVFMDRKNWYLKYERKWSKLSNLTVKQTTSKSSGLNSNHFFSLTY